MDAKMAKFTSGCHAGVSHVSGSVTVICIQPDLSDASEGDSCTDGPFCSMNLSS